MNIQEYLTGITLAKSAVDLVSGAVDLIPDSPKKEAAKTALEQSRKAFEVAETQAAEQLGYPLCKCDFPPGICTLNDKDRFICRKCGRDQTPDEFVGFSAV